MAENASSPSRECTLRMYTVVADHTNTANKISSCRSIFAICRVSRGQISSTVPAKPITSPMRVRRSIAWARRPRVASSAIHNAAEALRIAVWFDATCCIAQLVQLLGMNTLPTATMSRAHIEISHLIKVFGRVLDEMPAKGPGPEDIREIRRILYGLYAILTLHFAQEEESYLALIEERTKSDKAGPG